MTTRILLVLTSLLSIFLSNADAQPSAILHVNRTDAACGGQSPCYATIQAAIDAAQPGATVRIQSGVYPEQLKIENKNAFAGAVETDRIVIESDPDPLPGQVVLTGSAGHQCTDKYAIRLKQSKFITIRGLTITGTGAQAINLMGGNNGNHGIHIELNRIFANGSSSCDGGITINRGNPGTLIVNNLIYANGRNGISFSDADGGPHYIINNTIYGNQWNGVDVARGHTVTLANNIINSNGTASGTTGGRFGLRREGSNSPQPAGIKLLNNLVCGNTQGQISTQVLDATDSSNYTPLGDEGAGVGALPGCELATNLFGNLNGNDNKPNTADDDFSLKANSLAIDVGMDPRTLGFNPSYNPIFEADFVIEGIRPADGNADRAPAFDAGAFEFPNAPPEANAGANQTGHRGQLMTLNGSLSSDPEGAALSYQWTIVSQPAGSNITLAGAATAAPTFTPLVLGDYNFQLIVSDGQFNSAPATVTISAINRGPTADAGGPYTGVVGTAVQFSGAATDPDGDALTFSWTFGDGGVGSGQTPMHAYTAIGTYTVALTVTDSVGASAVAQTTATIDGVSITSVDPPTGVIGTLITISGGGFEPGTTQVTFNGVSAVIRAITAGTITTTVPPTATSGTLTVATSRGSASRNFTITTSQDFDLTVNPSIVQSVQGGSTSILIDAIPSNGFAGLIHLATGSLPSGVVANFSPSTLAPNNHSSLALRTGNGTPTGAYVVEIRATSQIDGQTVTHTANVTMNIVAQGQTVLVGQVLDGDDRPLRNVSIKLGGTTLVHLGSSDAAGNLFIPLSVGGPTVFLIDGSPANTATTNYPTIPITLDIQPGVSNELGYVPRMRGQPVARLTSFVPGQATVITDPDLPGFKMTIPAGVQIIGWDGQPNSQFGVTTVPIDRSPLPPLALPPGLEARQIYLFSFGKVGGGLPTGNIPIDTPNNVGALPREKVDLYFFNEAPDGSAPNRWEKYGTATVSDDGTTLVTDINPATGSQYGIPRFCCGALAPVFNFLNRLFGASGGPSDGGKQAGDPVDVATGFFYVDKTDMVLPGRLPVVVTRTYRSNMPNSGPFGIGTSASFDISLQAPNVFNDQTIVLISPGNKQDIFSRQTNGTYINATSPALRGAVLSIGSTEPIYSLRFKDGMVWRFNSAGLLTRQTDRNGNQITFTRDNFSRVVSIQEPAGRSLAIAYVGSPGQGLPNIQTITDPIGRQVRYTYDVAGRLETVTDPGGGITRYTYDSANRMLTLRDSRGITFLTSEYDSEGRVVRQTQADGGIWTFAYTSSGTYISEATVTNPRGHATTYRFNAAGYQISETDALGQTSTFERQAGTNLILSISDPIKRVTLLEYDAVGNLTRVIDPAGNARVMSYSASFNKVTAITDALGNTGRFEYDSKGNLSAVVDPLRSRTTIAHNSFGQPINTTDPLSNATGFGYDPAGNLSSITNPLGNSTQRSYDQVSRLIAQIDPRGKVTKFSYDPLNRIVENVDPQGGTTRFGYDGNGNLLSITDPRGSVTSFTYDSMDRVATRTDPVGAIESFQYDRMGNLVRHTDRKAQQAIFAYDELDRQISGNYSDGANTTYVYDIVSRLVQATDSAGGSIANSYDSLDRLIAQISDLGNVRYEYDALGRRTRMTVPGQFPTTYAYDANSRLRQVEQGAQIANIEYDVLGRRTLLTLPNAVRTEYQYDPASRLTTMIYRNSLGVLGDLQYRYDKQGNRISVGGSFARISLPGSVSSATYDDANRQLQFGNNSMMYDATGNLTRITNPSGVTNYIWDARNRLSFASEPTTNTSFTYDAFERRARKTRNGHLTRYLYDGLNPAQEGSGSKVVANILTGPEIDEFLSRTNVPSDIVSYPMSDALGSTIALSDPAGAIRTEYTYETFGNTTVSGASNDNPFQYTGRENDGADLYYYRARYYHSRLQRFMSEDPIGFIGGDLNLFAYVQNNPTKFRDPTGEFVHVAVVGGVLCATGAVAGASAHHQLSGRKSSFAGLLASTAAGCAAGLGFGWLTGVAVELAMPSIMTAGGNVGLWSGLGKFGPALARMKAAEIGAATIYDTFAGSTLTFLETIRFAPLAAVFWPTVSNKFVSGAGSATILVGRGLSASSVLLTKELPVLLKNQATLQYIFHP